MKFITHKLIILGSFISVAILSGVVFTLVLGPVNAITVTEPAQVATSSGSIPSFNLMTPPTQLESTVTGMPGEEWRSMNYYLKLEGLEGEPTMIEIMSWSFGATNAGSMAAGSGGGAGKASFSDLSFMKRIDKSTPLLFNSLATGKHFPKATLVMRKTVMNSDGTTSEEEVGYYTFFDIFVEAIYDNGWQGTEAMESISLNYTKIEMVMLDQSFRFGWDLKQNKKI